MSVKSQAIDQKTSTPSREVEVSVVMPCLNEVETLGICIQKTQQAFAESQIRGEIIIADNGSTDGSQQLAESLGARVVNILEKGYGSAVRGGIEAAQGQYVLFGDSDDSYNFLDLPRFVQELRRGAALVMGNRFQGSIQPGAMPWLHQHLGTPVLTRIGQFLFGCPVGDFNCGLRALTKDAYYKMQLATAGMEFASEMVIKATLKGMVIVEIPIVLYPDKRSRPPHLRTWRDGWRNLRFMLLLSPRWLFFIPGLFTFLLGLLAVLALCSGSVKIQHVNFDIHTLLVASTLCVVGHQLITFGLFSKQFAIREQLHPESLALERWGRKLTLETGVVAGIGCGIGGLVLLASALYRWQQTGFGDLDPSSTMRLVIPAMLMVTLGVQTFFGSFFLGVLNLQTPKKIG